MWELYNPKNEMKNPTGNKLEKLVFGIFDQMVEGADKYVTKQGSTWLIFTESKKWVIEFTKDKTLWFNFNLFQGELDLIGKDCVEERDLIKNWFESRFLNKPKVEETKKRRLCPSPLVEDTIQNGVKETIVGDGNVTCYGEDAIQNGVKETTPSGYLGSIEMKGKIVHQIESPKQNNEVEDTIQNGVKNTEWYSGNSYGEVEDTIQNGVRHTNLSVKVKANQVEDTIQNGVKDTVLAKTDRLVGIEDTIENGVKETKDHRLDRIISVISTIKNGVKELKELPDKSGEFRGYGDWYRRQGNMTKPHTEYVKEVIEDSYNHRARIEGVIRNTNKDGI